MQLLGRPSVCGEPEEERTKRGLQFLWFALFRRRFLAWYCRKKEPSRDEDLLRPPNRPEHETVLGQSLQHDLPRSRGHDFCRFSSHPYISDILERQSTRTHLFLSQIRKKIAQTKEASQVCNPTGDAESRQYSLLDTTIQYNTIATPYFLFCCALFWLVGHKRKQLQFFFLIDRF